MPYHVAADGVLILHFAFVLFVALGGFLVLLWRRVAWVHVPAVLWGPLIEFTGWICPLTPLEVSLRRAAGGEGYAGDFLEHYIIAALYPESLTRGAQMVLGAVVLVVNVAIYAAVLWRSCLRRGRT